MQMQQIRYFVTLCEQGNFTQAAKRCGVSQPSLTNAINALERELGGPLFRRSFRRRPLTAMTALAHAMQPYMRRIVQTADEAIGRAEAFRQVKESR